MGSSKPSAIGRPPCRPSSDDPARHERRLRARAAHAGGGGRGGRGVDRCPPLETLFLSSVTVAALRSGVALLPKGKRRSALLQSLEKRLLPLSAGRVLPFDPACTQADAALVASARSAGVAIAAADGSIAAIAVINGLAVATRDARPFRAAVVAPWQT